jgi:hypothetical protein
MVAERFVVLGVAHARAGWLGDALVDAIGAGSARGAAGDGDPPSDAVGEG